MAAEAGALTELARASKASWGYPQDLLAQMEAELTVPEAAIVDDTVAVCVSGDDIVGFYWLVLEGRKAEVENCYVSPAAQRQGVGAALMNHLKDTAKAAGALHIKVQSDPHAEGFYEAMGYTRCGQSPSGSIPGRFLPVLEMSL